MSIRQGAGGERLLTIPYRVSKDLLVEKTTSIIVK